MATAFAVFCADDGSLTFYKRDTVPTAGEEFEGKVASNVYEGFETESYSSASAVPWYNERTSILSVSFVDEIAPEYTQCWFRGASSIISFDAANLNTSNITNMRYMFTGCSSLTTLDLSSFDTSNVTNMRSMFSECSGLTTLDVTNFNTSKVTDMMHMFSECSSLTTLDVTNFNTNNVTNMQSMFSECNKITTIYVSERWSTTAVTSSIFMFYNCTSLAGDIPYDPNYTDATYATYIGGYLTNRALFDYLIKGGTLMDLADQIRVLSATSDSMNPIQMSEVLSNIRDAKEVAF